MESRNRARRGTIATVLATGALVVALAAGCSSPTAQTSSGSASSEAAASGTASSTLATSEAASTTASSPAAESAQAASPEPVEPEILEIGDDAKGTATMTVVNETGSKIANIAFTSAGSEDDPVYLMDDGQTWKKGEEALVHFEKLGKGSNYDVHVKVKKGDYTLHDLDLTGVDELEIRMEDGIAYAAFERDGNAISTLSDEVERAEAEAAEAEAANSEEYYEDEVYYEDDSYYEEPAQQEDGCVDGGVQLR